MEELQQTSKTFRALSVNKEETIPLRYNHIKSFQTLIFNYIDLDGVSSSSNRVYL